MKMQRILAISACAIALLTGTCLAANATPGNPISELADVGKYNRAIHVMAMLLAGFGFLMVFVKRYGRSAVTATYLLVSVAIPLYLLKDRLGILGATNSEIDGLILAEFCGGKPSDLRRSGAWAREDAPIHPAGPAFRALLRN